MIFDKRFGEEKEQAYQADRSYTAQSAQRWLVLVGGSIYCAGSYYLPPQSGDAANVLGTYSVFLFAFTLILFGLTFVRFVQDRSELIPTVIEFDLRVPICAYQST